MNVSELRHLSEWFTEHYSNLQALYGALISPIQHNAAQPSKQPVEAPLEALIDYLRQMSFDELSLQELKTLSDIEVDRYLGNSGADFVDSLVRTSQYDPQTAASKMQEALNKINEVHPHFSSYLTITGALGFGSGLEVKDSNAITIRVGFQNEAAIDNVTAWKDSARDWYDIIRGVALAVGEAPENTKVIGATNGSIILVLAATATVTGLLALISKNVTSVTKDVIDIRSSMEDLKSKEILNDAMKAELENLENQKKSNALAEIIITIRQTLPDLDGSQITALEKSVKKLLKFNENGGNLDFVAPENDLSEDESDETQSARDNARNMIEQYQALREKIKLIENRSKKL